MHALTIAAHAALAGARLLRGLRSRAAGLSTKSSPTDIVLDADRASEAAIVAILRREFPDDAIVSEEGGAADAVLAREAVVERGVAGSPPPAKKRTWLVDPLDGTVNYFFGIPHSAVTMAVADAAGPLCGATADVWRDEIFLAARGLGAWLGRPSRVDEWLDPAARAILTDSLARLSVRDEADLAQALIGTGFAYDASARALQGELAARVLPKVRDVRRLGSAALDLAYVAAGRLSGYYESGVQPWDVLAGTLLVREAGGEVTEPPRIGADERGGIIASAPGIHRALRGLLR